jgi:hypothetical protein
VDNASTDLPRKASTLKPARSKCVTTPNKVVWCTNLSPSTQEKLFPALYAKMNTE